MYIDSFVDKDHQDEKENLKKAERSEQNKKLALNKI